MFKNIDLNIEEFMRQLKPKWLKPIRIIFLALNAGVIVFNLIGLYIYFSNIGQTGDAFYENLLNTLLIVEAAVVICAIIAARYIPPIAVKKQDIIFDPKQPALNILNVYQAFMIMRLAILEGAALFGCVFLFAGIINYALYANPVYWIMTTPTFILIGYSILNFPTVERITLFYEKYKK